MSRNRLRTDLGLIRQAFELTDQLGSQLAAATVLGISDKNITRWRLRQMLEPNGWPTDQDIEDWRADHAAHQVARARRAAQNARYLQRTYLNRGPLLVPKTGTVRRVRALVALGYTMRELGQHLGVTHQVVSLWVADARATRPIHTTRAQAVTALYDRLCMTPATGPFAARQRAYAARRGWAPPLCWDEDTIDDPNAHPQGLESSAA